MTRGLNEDSTIPQLSYMGIGHKSSPVMIWFLAGLTSSITDFVLKSVVLQTINSASVDLLRK